MFVIYNPETGRTLRENGSMASYATMRGAKASRTRKIKSGTLHPQFKAASYEEYQKQDIEVEVKNLMNGKPVMIRRSDVGGPCDPSTERYWSM